MGKKDEERNNKLGRVKERELQSGSATLMVKRGHVKGKPRLGREKGPNPLCQDGHYDTEFRILRGIEKTLSRRLLENNRGSHYTRQRMVWPCQGGAGIVGNAHELSSFRNLR